MSLEHQFLPLIIAFQLGECPHMVHDYFPILTTKFTPSILQPFHKARIWHIHGLWQFVIVNIELRISLFETLIVEDSVLLLSLGIVVRNDKVLVLLILLANFPCGSVQFPAK